MTGPLDHLDFIGPLSVEVQRWADETLAADSASALFEPLTAVLLRREAQVAAAFTDAALLFQAGSEAAWDAVHRAIAQGRALAWLAAADPAGCWECLLGATPCERHRRLADRRSPTPHDGRPGAEPEWRRFGSEAT